MDYIITDGSRYISSKSGIHTVNKIKQAGKFELDKANNVLKSMPNTLKMFNWKCIPYTDITENKEADIKEIESVDKSFTDYTGLTDNILEKMMDWEKYIKNLKDYMATIDVQLSKVDMEISDIEHAAEFYDLDMFRAWKLYKMLQDARRRRRKIKDERIKVEYILGSNFMDCTNSAISNYIKSLDNRKYNPRVLKELFNV